MPEQKVQCPHCNEIFELELPGVPADQLIDHRHKSADEFLDCPECRQWVDRTAQRYQVVAKEIPPQPGEEKEPEPPDRPATGSIFRQG